MSKWHIGHIAASIVLMLGITTPSAADDFDDCFQSPNPELRIRGCTSLIEAGRLDGYNLAISYNNRGYSYHEKGDLDRAIADYDRALEINPNLASTYENRGGAYGQKGDLDRAIANFDRALEIDPSDASAYYNRGHAYSKKGDLDRAIADYDRAIETDPNYANAYYNRGSVYGKKGDLDRAITNYDRAIEIDPNYASAYYNRGHTYGQKGDPDRAIADYDRAIEIDPNDSNAYFNRGRANYEKGNFESAIRDFAQLADSGNAYGALWLFMAQSRTGQDAATELSTNAVNTKADEWPYQIMELYLGNRSPDETLAAASNTDERCDASFYIGEWHLMHDRQDEAIPALRSAVETCPKNFIEYSVAVAELERIGR